MRKCAVSLILCLYMVFSLVPVPVLAQNVANDNPFADVEESDWFYDGVQYVFEHELMKGTRSTIFETLFEPERATQRGMIVTILYRLDGSPPVTAICPFEDVPHGSNYENAIIWAASKGIVTGYTDTSFGPYDDITRQQMAAILYRYANVKHYDVTKQVNLNVFTDSVRISNYARTPLSWANAEELINGITPTTLAPTEKVTRAQSAVILTRFCENIVEGEESVEPSPTATYTVTFDLNYTDAGTNQRVSVEQGKTVPEPDVPKRSGYKFKGWYTATDTQKGVLFDFNTAINADITLYARWTSNSTSSNHSSNSNGTHTNITTYYTVTFNTNNGNVIQPQHVVSGNVAVRPIDPIREGYIFGGWYSDRDFTALYNFSAIITQNITLYAKWTPVYVVSFEANGDAVSNMPQPQKIEGGKKATEPPIPIRIGYTFNGWSLTSDSRNRFDFNTAINANISLYAQWNKVNSDYSREIEREDIEEMASNGSVEVIVDENNDIRAINGNFTSQIINTSSDAVVLLNSTSHLFGNFSVVAEDDILYQSYNDEKCHEGFYRYSPSINGIPVLGSQIIITVDNDGYVTGAFNNYNPLIDSVDTTPSITATEAEIIAIRELLKEDEMSDFRSSYGTIEAAVDAAREFLTLKSELIIYSVGEDKSPKLSYAVFIGEGAASTRPNTLNAEYYYYILANGDEQGHIFDKADSRIFLSENSDSEWVPTTYSGYRVGGFGGKSISIDVEMDKASSLYRLHDTIRNITVCQSIKNGSELYTIPGEVVTFQKTTYFSDPLIAHYNIAKTYDFYKALNRNSYDNNSSAIVATLGYNAEENNAYWSHDKKQFVFGTGHYERALDVIGHEFTHAVFGDIVSGASNTPILLYDKYFHNNEFRALNESYADIMGNLIEGKTNDNRWLIGEDGLRVVRNLAHPELSRASQPDFYSDVGTEQWKKIADEAEHTYCGIFNRAAYIMMTDPRTGNVTSNEWAALFYNSMYRLPVAADFLDARAAIIITASKRNFTAEQILAIRDAFDAVEIKETRVFTVKGSIKKNAEYISGATVRIIKRSDHSVVEGTTNGKGRFSLPCDGIDYKSKDVATTFWNNYSVEIVKFGNDGFNSVVISSPTGAIYRNEDKISVDKYISNVYNLSVIDLTLSVSGEIVDSSSNTPLVGAEIQVYHQHTTNDVLSSGISDDNGSFCVNITNPGQYQIKFVKSGYEQALTNIEVSYNTLATKELVIPTISMNPTSNTVAPVLSGSVADSQTKLPLPEVEVFVLDSQNRNILFTSKTNSDGSFSISLEKAGVYDLLFSKHQYINVEMSGIQVLENSVNIGTAYMVAKPIITGTICDAETNQPLMDVDVLVYEGHNYNPSYTGRTDTTGSFSIAVDQVATYYIVLQKDGYESKELDEFSLSESTYSLGTITMRTEREEPPIISGIVEDSGTHQTLADVEIFVYEENAPNPSFTGSTDANGVFSIILEETGRYVVVFHKSGYTDERVEDVIVITECAMGHVSLKISGGDGTKDNPYVISTAEQFNNIRNDLSAYYLLDSDIDLSIYDSWNPISAFSGNLDGAGHSILGLKITSEALTPYKEASKGIGAYFTVPYIGLFSWISGTVKNLTVDGANIKISLGDDWYYGANIGVIAGVEEHSTAVIENCTVSGLVHVIGPSQVYVGGIVGLGGNIIRNCTNRCAIVYEAEYYRSDSVPYIYAAGISGTSGNCISCTNSGPVAVYLELRTMSRAYSDYFTWGMRWFHTDGIAYGASQVSCTNYGSVEANVAEFPYGMQHLYRWWDEWLDT